MIKDSLPFADDHAFSPFFPQVENLFLTSFSLCLEDFVEIYW